MRFRFAASLAMGQALVQTVMAVTFAYWGFGAYSLLLPRLCVAMGSAIVCWTMAPVAIRPQIQFRRWRLLAGDGGRIIAANACELALSYGGYLILSVMCDLESVGLYYFAFTLSLQTFALITQSLSGVLFPALNTLHGQPTRQADAFLRATRVLATIVFPACFLQAAISEPAIRLLFDQKWTDAIPLLQALSIGMAMRGVGAPSVALFQAQNRFSARLGMAIISVIVFLVLAVIGAWLDGARGMAIAVALHSIMVEPFNLWVAIKGGGRGGHHLWVALFQPMLIGGLIVLPALLAGRAITAPSSPGLSLSISVFVATTLLIVVVRALAFDVWTECLERLRVFRRFGAKS